MSEGAAMPPERESPAGATNTVANASSVPSTSSTTSPANSNMATTATLHEEEDIASHNTTGGEELEPSKRSASPVRDRIAKGEHGNRNDNTRAVETEEDNSSLEDDENDDSEEDEFQEDEEQEEAPHTPRQGLPSFWYALRRLNVREPRSIIHSLNFFRWHVIVGIFVPLITAGIFCACNTGATIYYIDALFMCTSALTLTGLSTVLLADMSFGQQFILYLLLQFGSIQFVSLLVLYVRRSAFINRFGSSAPNSSQSTTTKSNRHNHWWWPHKSIWLMEDEEMKIANRILDDPDETPQLDEEGMKCERRKRKHNDMVRRRKHDSNAKNGQSWITTKSRGKMSPSTESTDSIRRLDQHERAADGIENGNQNDDIELRRIDSPTSMTSGDYASHPLKDKYPPPRESKGTARKGQAGDDASATSTSHAEVPDKRLQKVRQRNTDKSHRDSLRRSTIRSAGVQGRRANTGISNNTTATSTARHSGTGSGTNNTKYAHHISARGGFPNPIHAIFSEGVYQLKKRTANSSGRSGSASDFDIYRSRTGTGLPRSDTRASRFSQPARVMSRLRGNSRGPNTNVNRNGDIEANNGQKISGNISNLEKVPTRQLSLPHSGYRFGRNSTVRDLSRDAHLKLAHLEISGMTLLMYIIFIWWIGLQLLFVIIWSPYFEAGHFRSVFEQYNPNVSRTWFSVFQTASMLNNCGLSLIDGSLTPFRTCYIMLVPAVFLMLIGNLGYPVSLRFTIWLIHSCLRGFSKLRFITAFVLAHPRRIFYYIFPPYETQALFLVVMLLTAIDWACFFLLDIGFTSPVFSISTGSAVISGLVQSVAVRSAGFYTVPLFEVAPALDMLYLFMMAFCIYPLALAIRATNVYEERSLGIHSQDEGTFKNGIANLRREKGYSKFHLREQLAYDVWYILLAFWLICIVERNNIGITGAAPAGSIDMFAILFEVTSAYANVGFSIGTPTSDTSISGGLRHLSKLILCITMLRGRTRGLPVLVDRAVLTPRQLERYGDPAEGGDHPDKTADEVKNEGDQ